MRTARLSLIAVCCLVLGMASACKQRPTANVHMISSAHDPCSSNGEYFPPIGSTWSGNGLHWIADQGMWEINLLKHMHEPSLYACSSAVDEPVYRFFWDRSLSEPISARLTVHKDGSGTLIIRTLANSGIPPPPISLDELFRLKSEQQIAATPEQVNRALSLFSGIDFWKIDPSKGETTDGSDWIFESKVGGKYHLIDFRNQPTQSAREFGLYLVMGLGKVSIPPQEIY